MLDYWHAACLLFGWHWQPAAGPRARSLAAAVPKI
jgi:hypothetical protein